MKSSILIPALITIVTIIIMFAMNNPSDRIFIIAAGILIAVTMGIAIENHNNNRNKKQ